MHPTAIKLHKKSGILELKYADDKIAELNAEYLRVFSPSAEVQGHHPSQAVLQYGKRWVKIQNILPVGNYAIQIEFDDGHNSGIYSWELLWNLFENREQRWQDYLDRLSKAGKHRDPEQQTLQIFDPKNN